MPRALAAVFGVLFASVATFATVAPAPGAPPATPGLRAFADLGDPLASSFRPVARAAATPAFLAGYTFTDLGADVLPVAINNKLQLAVQYTHPRATQSGTVTEGAVWDDGAITVLGYTRMLSTCR